ncbi:Xaa-Pro dipeptidase [Microbulbifer thermotolerans]|uniref:Xaa-Pro dipeptidase n=1 Tax=Microbulbifer thermotolerans TaxID=252514 RepID=A0AB35I497_MICTH|nr:Xaa-Pro dipeptidase [Microbulbifer thermotolerans]MCX2781150.1 Xaa-Pro dipeptidase [Microbulbifer thermotolerans]MCX2803165.1 Xaa-Pro dipeptidase [Microbulbifer thermotolerans]MCX2804611.1 Xaa-Pro dipeptidase [Microbulbifer thermotolerans]
MDKNLYAEHIATLQRRYDDILEACGFDTLNVFSGAPKVQFLDDNYYPFKVNPQFKALVPVTDNPHSWVIYRRGQKPKLLFYRPVDFWHYVPPAPQTYWSDFYDIELIASPADAKQFLSAEGAAFLGEADGLDGWPLGTPNPEALLAQLHWARAYKTPYELACLRQANRIAVKAHRAAEAAFREGASEFEINLAYLQAAAQGENRMPYGNIIALNEHAAILHYTHLSEQRLPESERRTFLIDAGADCNGYCADITRTYAYRDGEFADLVAAMDEKQQELVAGLKPGLPYPDLHRECHRKVGELLHRFGVIKTSADNAVESGLTGTFMPHGLGHFLGLQVHDVGGHQAGPEGGVTPPPAQYPFLRTTRTIEENQVFTIEPGLYFIDSLLAELKDSELAKEVNWSKVDALRPFGGVRIEDNAIVRADGVENITRDCYAED